MPPFELQRLAAGGSLSVTRPTMGHFMRTAEERAWRYRELFFFLAWSAYYLAFQSHQKALTVQRRLADAESAAHAWLAEQGCGHG